MAHKYYKVYNLRKTLESKGYYYNLTAKDRADIIINENWDPCDEIIAFNDHGEMLKFNKTMDMVVKAMLDCLYLKDEGSINKLNIILSLNENSTQNPLMTNEDEDSDWESEDVSEYESESESLSDGFYYPHTEEKIDRDDEVDYGIIPLPFREKIDKELDKDKKIDNPNGDSIHNPFTTKKELDRELDAIAIERERFLYFHQLRNNFTHLL